MAVTTEQATHAQAIRTPISQVAAYSQDALGQRLTAVIAGVSDAKAVGQWALGKRVPGPQVQQRLRHAYQITAMLLNDEAPAFALAERPPQVLQAARDFRAHG